MGSNFPFAAMSFAIPVAKRRMRHGVRMERRGADHPSAHERRLRVHRARVSTPTMKSVSTIPHAMWCSYDGAMRQEKVNGAYSPRVQKLLPRVQR